MLINIREVTKPDLTHVSKIHVDVWKTTYKNILPSNYLSSLSYDNQLEKWTTRLITNNIKNEFMYVVCYDNIIVGFSSANLESSKIGTINTLYIQDYYQKLGLGKQLFLSMKDKLIKLGSEKIFVWCFEQNPNKNFYIKCNGIQSDEQYVEIAGTKLKEVQFLFTV